MKTYKNVKPRPYTHWLAWIVSKFPHRFQTWIVNRRWFRYVLLTHEKVAVKDES